MTESSPPRARPLWPVLAVLALSSCADPDSGHVTVHPARGQVLYQGKPLAEALIVLQPVKPSEKDQDANAPPRPTARSDADGQFRLQTYYTDDGAPAGEYLVSVSLPPAPTENRDLMKKETPKPARDVLGNRYLYADKSGLKVEIKPGENVLKPIDLK